MPGVVVRKLIPMFLMLFVVVVWAGPKDDFTRGFQAYKRGAFTLAVKWWQKAAEQGLSDAQAMLGYLYDSGQGVRQDHKMAVKWYRNAAEQGHAVAQNNLGYSYELGQGVPQNHKMAVKWYRNAAEQGHAVAQNKSGYSYERGQGVPQDYKMAVKWYRTAAEQGYPVAQNNLGYFYELGQGVRQDHKMAVKWYRMAAAQKNQNAQANLRRLNTKVATSATRKKTAGNTSKNSDRVAQAKAKARKYTNTCLPGNKYSCGDEMIKAAQSKWELATGWSRKAIAEVQTAKLIVAFADEADQRVCAREHAEADRLEKAGIQQLRQKRYDAAIANYKKAVSLLRKADCGLSSKS